ncbi:hypothetical protein PC129_g4194 [Phytophthora cactorum]|uniref:Uncharacterized protein n=1 Tax=Phytophthora cactorum TaxID=29920 RepID=A0A8T0ZJW1_9STRA|nr:hypothetical protein PC113_g5788 [Phytophthora cactorum]KAG2920221.1 hypothetical protein PC114_g6148 [Phytophthora cactorum]KAG2991428.1 hypothetical protein PC118_g5116 [Phytophthora cactorum]KAG3032933.1 hypothetical protein PC119_g5523 [Phytophthora cactorum]KAG3182242.1 hypothetical protein C6341_g6026 [Phytophthora cactorum]
MADYPTCRFAGVQSVITKSSRAKKHYEDMVTSELLGRSITHTSEVDVDTLLLPTGFFAAHP